MEVDKDQFVPMRDGVHLAVDIYRPDLLSRHAAVLIITPYKKDAQFDMPIGSDGRRMTALPIVIPPGVNPMLLSVKPLVDAGFVVAVADARGTGFSEGNYDYYNLVEGPFDGYDLVEWLAEQPWCDGNVGITGGSAAAISCYTTALTHPPHLRAMAPNMHPADFYTDQWRIGGVFRYENRIGWATSQYGNISPIDPGDPESPGYERRRAVYEARFDQWYRRIAAGQNPANLDWLTKMYQHDAYDDFWRSRSFLRRAQETSLPTLHSGVWYDHFVRGTVASHEASEGPKRLFVGPGSLATRPELGDGGLTALQIAWFDHFLRGAKNDVLAGPQARLYLLGDERYVDMPSWPVPAVPTRYHLASSANGSVGSGVDGALLAVPRATDTSSLLQHDPANPNRTPPDPADQRSFEEGCLTFSSAVLEADLTVVGTPRLVLHATTNAPDVDFCVRLCDVFPDGRSRLLNTGALKGSHVGGHENPTALVAGQIYEFDIEIWPTANVFRAGHRIRVDVSTSDFPFFEVNQHPSNTEVFHDSARPSHLLLPVVESPLPETGA
ncbi:CocE/NonD family hydrolase [Frankia gtarii]|uniref:CocE/NonD family hydrolase n=1 Tax=Frankia gtarii TaxID=2950102 RepID=UPI0021C14579|nr:CocE/NonD family hydrolase [Frankia gtarii]